MIYSIPKSIIFVLVLAVTIYSEPVTFRLNMSFQAELGRFLPGVDVPDIAGPFNDWVGGEGYTLTDDDADSIYVGTFDIPVGEYEYKFRFNGTWDYNWDWVPDSNTNRFIQVNEGGNDLDPVWYASLEPAPVHDVEVLFQVDISPSQEVGGALDLNLVIPFMEIPHQTYNLDGPGDILSTEIVIEQLVVGEHNVQYHYSNNILPISDLVFQGTETDSDNDGYIELITPMHYWITDSIYLPPPTFSNASFLNDGIELELRYDVPSEISGFIIQRREDDFGGFVLLDTLITQFNQGVYVDSSIAPSNLYSYRARAMVILNQSYGEMAHSQLSEPITMSTGETPIIETIADISMMEDGQSILSPSVSDPDSDELNYSIEFEPAVITATQTDNEFLLEPDQDWNGITLALFIANDGYLADSVYFQIIVQAINDPPELAVINSQNTLEEVPIEITIHSTDVDEDTLTYSATCDTNAVQVYLDGNTLTLNPTLNWNGLASVMISASDSEFQVFESFILTVTNVNDAPVINTLTDQIILEDSSLVLNPTVFDIDYDDLSISAFDIMGVITISSIESSLEFRPIHDWYGTVPIGVIVTDGEYMDSTYFNLTVTNINDLPTAIDENHSVQESAVNAIILNGITGPENESDQSLSYSITGLPSEGFLSDVEGGTALTAQELPFTLFSDTVYFWQNERFELTTFEFLVQDDGGVENGGIDLSESATISLALNIPFQFSLTTAGPVEGGVTMIDSNILYVASSGDGVHRYDENGNAIYTLNVDGDIKSSTTITTNHIVYIASTDNSLYSFNANGISNTGWPVSLGAEATASVAVDASGTAYIGTSNGIFQAVAATGEVSWGYNVGGAVYASAAISPNNTLYIVNENGRLFAFDLNTLIPSNIQYSWVYDLNEAVYSSPALDDLGYIYLTTLDGNLIKLEDNGTEVLEIWRYSVGAEIYSSPVIGSDYTIYYGANNSTIYGVDTDGSLKWASVSAAGALRSTPALAESGTSYDRLYIGSDDGFLYAVSLIDGSITWKYNAQSPIQCPILFSDATVYFGTQSGDVIAIQDEEIVPLLAKMAEVSPIWPTFQGNNARTGMLGGGTSIPAFSNVHPGDADNDGDVDAQDILPIGVYFLENGHSRSSAGMGWSSQEVTSWESYPANYADCNGDGVIDEKDVIAIGVNWGQTHEDGLLKYRIDPANHDLLNRHKESFERLYSSLGSNMGAPGVAMKRVLEEVLQFSPSEYVLYQNYPNPFNPDTEIQFSLPKTTQVSLRVFNIRGEIVTELINGNNLNGGYHSETFKGSEYSSGVYFYDLSTPDYHAVKKMLLVK